ncbi:MAG: hypothetical protein JNM57_07580 [Cyclobacteriaceae bacterium]|nr:hypothetical protein [Cyclobacteriaceae bacterium]
MKSVFLVLLLVGCVLLVNGQEKRVYTTTSGEIIFSFADIRMNGSDVESVIRFAPVLNLQSWVNVDYTDKFGVFTGLSLRNVGFIYDVPNSNQRKKARTYNFGIPLGVKLGNLDNLFFFGGYELEIPFNYKEKTFVDEEKEDKFTVWFSKRTPTFSHSLMAGVQLPKGLTLKFKYYLTNFYKKSYSTDDEQGNPYKPYENMDVNVFYISLNFGLLKNSDFYYSGD